MNNVNHIEAGEISNNMDKVNHIEGGEVTT